MTTAHTPYYAVIFTSERTDADGESYAATAGRMVELASQEEGFLGIESARSEIGITVSYWRSLEDIARWKKHAEHTMAREKGRADWYKSYTTRICKVEREYSFKKEG